MKQQIIIRKFKSENQERAFWGNLDLSEYFEATDFKHVAFPKLKPTKYIKSKVDGKK